MNWNSYDTKYIIKRLIIGFGMLILFTILTTHKANALEYNPGGTYYRITGTNNWRGANKHTYNADPYLFWAISPEAYSVGVLYEYGLPIGEGTLQLAVVVEGKVAYVPQVKISANGEQILCMNSLMQAYGNSKVFNYYCEGYKFTGGYNSVGINFEYDASAPNIAHIGISKDMHIAQNGSGGITDAINNQSQQQHQDSQAINNSINNDNITSSDADNFKNNEAFSDSTGLESVINLPLNMVNSLSNECQPIQLHIPYLDVDATIPCMSTIYRSKFNNLYQLVKLVVNGFLVYRILLKVYELVHEAKQPDEDKLEVIEL